MEIKPVDTLAHIRKNKVMYLGRDEVIPDLLACSLANDPLVLGAKSVNIQIFNDWILISSDIDWLLKGTEKKPKELFINIEPLLGGGLNATRREAVVNAFAIALCISGEEGLVEIKGKIDDDLKEFINFEMKKKEVKRLIAFKCSN